mmetsp:Transcript_17320/g.43061  ORF Transcript_17320/g.43061 Transcript_17320/m.43061 type:complete len:920 (-) Transcript_17320:206-2965(-)
MSAASAVVRPALPWDFDISGKFFFYLLQVGNNENTFASSSSVAPEDLDAPDYSMAHVEIHGNLFPRPVVEYKQVRVPIGSDDCRALPGNRLWLRATVPGVLPNAGYQEEELVLQFSAGGGEVLPEFSRIRTIGGDIDMERPVKGTLFLTEERAVRSSETFSTSSGSEPHGSAQQLQRAPAQSASDGGSGSSLQLPTVRRIKVWVSEHVDAVEFVMSNGARKRYPQIGTPHNGRLAEPVFNLGEAEKLVCVTQMAGAYLEGIQFETNLGRLQRYGRGWAMEEGEEFLDEVEPRVSMSQLKVSYSAGAGTEDHIHSLFRHPESHPRAVAAGWPRRGWCTPFVEINMRDRTRDVAGYLAHFRLTERGRDRLGVLTEEECRAEVQRAARRLAADGGSDPTAEELVVATEDYDERVRIEHGQEDSNWLVFRRTGERHSSNSDSEGGSASGDDSYTDDGEQEEADTFGEDSEAVVSVRSPTSNYSGSRGNLAGDRGGGSISRRFEEMDLQLLPDELPLEMQARLGDIDSCPVCFENFTTDDQSAANALEKCVTWECGHAYCRQCAVNICRLAPPRHEGRCAVCRKRFALRNMFSVRENAATAFALVRCFPESDLCREPDRGDMTRQLSGENERLQGLVWTDHSMDVLPPAELAELLEVAESRARAEYLQDHSLGGADESADEDDADLREPRGARNRRRASTSSTSRSGRVETAATNEHVLVPPHTHAMARRPSFTQQRAAEPPAQARRVHDRGTSEHQPQTTSSSIDPIPDTDSGDEFSLAYLTERVRIERANLEAARANAAAAELQAAVAERQAAEATRAAQIAVEEARQMQRNVTAEGHVIPEEIQASMAEVMRQAGILGEISSLREGALGTGEEASTTDELQRLSQAAAGELVRYREYRAQLVGETEELEGRRNANARPRSA